MDDPVCEKVTRCLTAALVFCLCRFRGRGGGYYNRGPNMGMGGGGYRGGNFRSNNYRGNRNNMRQGGGNQSTGIPQKQGSSQQSQAASSTTTSAGKSAFLSFFIFVEVVLGDIGIDILCNLRSSIMHKISVRRGGEVFFLNGRPVSSSSIQTRQERLRETKSFCRTSKDERRENHQKEKWKRKRIWIYSKGRGAKGVRSWLDEEEKMKDDFREVLG